jgi:hypothetical protein
MLVFVTVLGGCSVQQNPIVVLVLCMCVCACKCGTWVARHAHKTIQFATKCIFRVVDPKLALALSLSLQ